MTVLEDPLNQLLRVLLLLENYQISQNVYQYYLLVFYFVSQKLHMSVDFLDSQQKHYHPL